jgi:hypothetical protein
METIYTQEVLYNTYFASLDSRGGLEKLRSSNFVGLGASKRSVSEENGQVPIEFSPQKPWQKATGGWDWYCQRWHPF